MDVDMSSKGSTSVVKMTERAKPTLVTVGDKQIISNGRWNDDLMADYVLGYGREKWIKIGDLAKVACGSNTIPNKKRVRRRLSSLFRAMLDRGVLLSVEYNGDYNSATAVKVADINSEQDRQNVAIRVKRMQARHELASDQYRKVTELLIIQLDEKIAS